MFGAIARRYDLNNRLHSLWRDQAWRRRAVGLCAVGPGDLVLDVACGTGDLSFAFAAADPAAVTGIDFTPEMIELARCKAAALRHPPTPQFLVGDALDLPFQAGTFDVVAIAFGIRNVADPGRALAEFRRVLRPGGRLLILEFAEPRIPIFRGLHRLYTRRVMPVTATLVAGDRSGAYRYLPRSIETFLEPGELARRVRDAGFGNLSQRSMTFGVCVATLAFAPGPESASPASHTVR
jgi:demethylmenaquinone methyltransferase/2-methoxy-6-polyprenyl-1,4-benzoquinol methylase